MPRHIFGTVARSIGRGCAAVSGRRARAVAKTLRVCDPEGLRGRRPPGPPAGGAAPAHLAGVSWAGMKLGFAGVCHKDSQYVLGGK